MRSENFEVVNGKIVMREAAVLNYVRAKPKNEAASKAAALEDETPPPPDKPSAAPLTVLKTIVGKIMSGELKVDPEVIRKVAEGINKSHILAKEPNKELLKHLVDELVNGTYKCDDKVLQGSADQLNKAQMLDKFTD